MIYLDYNASTPLDPAVREAMTPFWGERFGNPSSGHTAGKPLREAVERARGQVAALLGANAGEIVFNSGGTEGCNHVVKGVADALRSRGNHIITSAIEHPAVLNPCRHLQMQGVEVSYVGVNAAGQVDPQEVAGEIRPTTILISIMHANNEVGTIQNIREIAEIAREGGVLMHSDAAQSCGKVATRVDTLGVDFLSIAGHKFYAPQGIGALYIRTGTAIEPLHHGAKHQGGRRGGTEPVALIVGLGAAAEIAATHLRAKSPASDGKVASASEMARLRDRLWDGLKGELGERVALLGHPTGRLPNTACVAFRGRLAAEILEACPQLCASMGAACHSGKPERSTTLAAMDIPEELAFGAIRFSVGRFTTEAEVDQAIAWLGKAA